MSTVMPQERPTLADPAPWAFPSFESATLPGGLDVLYRHAPGQGLACVRLLLDAPPSAEPAELAGLAAITGGALTQGTARRTANDYASALDRVGASLSPTVGTGALWVSLTAPASRLREALVLLVEAVAQPTFPGREVSRLVAQRIEAIRRSLANPSSRASLAFREAAIDPAHRLHLPLTGSEETVGRIDRDAVQAFHAAEVAGRRATLVAAGDLTDFDVPVEVAAAFDGWPGTDADRLPPPAPVTSQGPKTVVVDRPSAAQTCVAVGCVGPDRHATDWADVVVGAHVLGGSLTSRLDTVLREEKGYTYGMRASAEPFRRGGLLTFASGSVETGVTEAAFDDMFAIIRTVQTDGVVAAERDAAVDNVVGRQRLSLETADALTKTVAANLEHGLPADHMTRSLAALQSTTVESVSAAAAARFGLDDAVVVAVGNAEHIVPALERLRPGTVDVVADQSPKST